MFSCASLVSRTHVVIDDVTRWLSRSNFEIDISPSIFELERRSKAQNVGNANGYLSGMFNFRYNFRWKSLSRAGGHFEIYEILNTASIWHQIWIDSPQKSIFHDDDDTDDVTGSPRIGPFIFLINEIIFFMITKKRAKILSLNFLSISIMIFLPHLYKYTFMASLMTSPDHKVGQILKLIFLRQYLS